MLPYPLRALYQPTPGEYVAVVILDIWPAVVGQPVYALCVALDGSFVVVNILNLTVTAGAWEETR